jgi:tetratricopeptide (TPR) repeat protein
MIELLIVALAAGVAFWQISRSGGPNSGTAPLAPAAKSPQLTQLTDYANRLYTEKKWLAAEKAFLNVLKLDHKNVGAFSHLGIIYSTQKNTLDAIECFEIAARLRPSGSSYQNLGMAYYENKNHVKAVTAFEKSIMFEPTVGRYIGLSKAKKQLADPNGTIRALEQASLIEPTEKILLLLEAAYNEGMRRDEARAVRDRINSLPEENRGLSSVMPAPEPRAPVARTHNA